MRLYFIHLCIIVCVKLMGSEAKIVAYECDANSTEKVTSFDAFDVHKCEEEVKHIQPQPEYIQILSYDPYNLVEVFQCKVETSVLKTGCGQYSHMYAIPNGYQTISQKVSRKKCLDMHTKRSVSLNNKSHRLNINESNYFTYIKGDVDKDGNCDSKAGSLMHQVIVEVRLRQIWVKVDTNSAQMYFPDGVTINYGRKHYYEPVYGYSYWNLVESVYCNRNRFSVLYRGAADSYFSPTYNSTVIYSRPDGAQFALPLSGQSFLVCKIFQMQPTIYYNLMVTRNEGRDAPYANGDIRSRATEFAAAKSVLEMDLLNARLQSQRCQMKALTQQVSYLLAVADPDEFAYFKMQAFGYTSLKHGDVIHIVKCQQQGVEIRTTDKCYNHIPIIKDNNTKAFMTVRTHIIKDTAEQVDCLAQHL